MREPRLSVSESRLCSVRNRDRLDTGLCRSAWVDEFLFSCVARRLAALYASKLVELRVQALSNLAAPSAFISSSICKRRRSASLHRAMRRRTGARYQEDMRVWTCSSLGISCRSLKTSESMFSEGSHRVSFISVADSSGIHVSMTVFVSPT